MHISSLFAVTLFLACVWCAPVTTTPSVHQLATFPGFIENIAVRSNGHLLLTSLQTASIYTLDPTAQDTSPSVLQLFPNNTGLSGITEISPDVFAVNGALWNLTTRRAALGSAAIWTIDLRHSSPKIEKLVDIPECYGLNGLTTIPGTSDLVLASDSVNGVVYRIDLKKRTYSVAVDIPDFKPTDGEDSLGINGIRTFQHDLYFANSALGLFGRLPISSTGSATGPVEILATINATATAAFDDFAIDEVGNAWVARHPSSLDFVGRNGGLRTVVNGSSTPDPTSAQFGRGKDGCDVLYVTTDVIGTTGVTGGVVAIDVKQW